MHNTGTLMNSAEFLYRISAKMERSVEDKDQALLSADVRSGLGRTILSNVRFYCISKTGAVFGNSCYIVSL